MCIRDSTKTYLYRIHNHPIDSPFDAAYYTRMPKHLDEVRMQAAAQQFVGTHDFLEMCIRDSNQTTVIGVAEARGVILLAAAQAGLPIYEYTPMPVSYTHLDVYKRQVVWHEKFSFCKRCSAKLPISFIV